MQQRSNRIAHAPAVPYKTINQSGTTKVKHKSGHTHTYQYSMKIPYCRNNSKIQ